MLFCCLFFKGALEQERREKEQEIGTSTHSHRRVTKHCDESSSLKTQQHTGRKNSCRPFNPQYGEVYPLCYTGHILDAYNESTPSQTLQSAHSNNKQRVKPRNDSGESNDSTNNAEKGGDGGCVCAYLCISLAGSLSRRNFFRQSRLDFYRVRRGDIIGGCDVSSSPWDTLL